MRPILYLSISVLAIAGCVNREAQQQAKRTEEILGDKTPVVVVEPAREQSVVDELVLTGQLTSSDDSEVGARIAGRLVAVYVKDGDPVSAGQVIAQQETGTLQAQLRQALGGVSTAQAQLSQAISQKSTRPKQSREAIRVAEAQLRAAKAQLAKVQRGARREEIRQAEIQVDAAKSNLDTARIERDRQKALFEEGATSRQRYEQALNSYEQALAGYQSAVEILNLRRNQVEPEDIQSATQSVRQAEANLRNALANQELDVTFDQAISAARANLSAAQASADVVREQIADATIRSPFSGTVAGKPAQIGAVLGPGTPVVRLIGSEGIYFEADTPETVVTQIDPGMPATISLNAMRGRNFAGRIEAINPQADALGRLFKTRISLDAQRPDFRAGMFGQARIQKSQMSNAVTVPTSAIVRDGGKEAVFVVENGKAIRKPVVEGISRSGRSQVKGISAGSRVIVQGQTSVKDQQTVKVESGAKESSAGE